MKICKKIFYLNENAKQRMSCTICNAKITILFKSCCFFVFFLQPAPTAQKQAQGIKELYQNNSSNFFSISSTVAIREMIVPLLFTRTAAGSSVMPYAAATSALPPAGLHNCTHAISSSSTTDLHAATSPSSDTPTICNPLVLYFP